MLLRLGLPHNMSGKRMRNGCRGIAQMPMASWPIETVARDGLVPLWALFLIFELRYANSS